MSTPLSTHLRVPRGFGALLEGLAREIIRDQPENIPEYAAQYFEGLLKQREESGMDPAEWAANLEDRFHKNRTFKATEVVPEKVPEKEPATQTTSSNEKNESETEDESSHSAEASNLPTTQPHVTQEADLTESTGEEDEKHDVTEENIISTDEGLPEDTLFNNPPASGAQTDELSETDEKHSTRFDQLDSTANENDSSSAPGQDLAQSDLSSFRGTSNVDVCAQELGTGEDEGDHKQETLALDKEIADSVDDERTEAEEPVEVFPYAGLADVDVCATELVATERTVEGSTSEHNIHVSEEDSLKPEEAVAQSSLSQSETLEDDQQVAEDQTEKAREEEEAETETPSGGIHESLTDIEGNLDSNAMLKDDSLVEISFEDVPEAQQNKDSGEKQPEVLQTNNLEMQQEEESKEESAATTDHNEIEKQDNDEPEVVGVEKEVNSEGEGRESQHKAFDVTNKKVDTNDSNLNDSKDDEMGEGVETISSSHQTASDADGENPQDETACKNEETEKRREEFCQKETTDLDFREHEALDTVGGDKEEDINTEVHSEVEDQDINDGGVENHPSEVHQTNSSASAAEAENESLEQLPEENEESHRGPEESQPEEAEVEKEVTSEERTSEAEGPVDGGRVDSEKLEKSDAMCEEGSISTMQSADQADDSQREERPLGSEEEVTETPEGRSDYKQEDCSRPQEEEDIMDIPLDDPEANRAAAKIQAGFRGHMTRKKMKPEDKAEGEEVSSTGDVLNGSQGDTETGGSGAVERDDTSVPEQ